MHPLRSGHFSELRAGSEKGENMDSRLVLSTYWNHQLAAGAVLMSREGSMNGGLACLMQEPPVEALGLGFSNTSNEKPSLSAAY